MTYPEYKKLDLPTIDREILKYWENDDTFKKSIDTRPEEKSFVFYEGPPSANGLPGIHHVIARSLKDIFCRYKTLKGYRVERKGGWDTHGLPVELKVEEALGITKKDIGTKITVEEYNQKCRESVLKFKHIWDDLTIKMGYWLDLDNPYITFENNYIESVWNIIGEFDKKNLLSQGYTIQPYSPAAGTGLSTHELNQPGAYRDVTDTTIVALFEIKDCCIDRINTAFGTKVDKAFYTAWTTTPWTLPSNTALTVGNKIEYSLIACYNPYTKAMQNIVIASDLVGKWFKEENEAKDENELESDDSKAKYLIIGKCSGSELVGTEYQQLFQFEANSPEKIEGDCFKVISGDFVTTSDGTGIVHTAPSFGADDRKVANENGIGELKMVDLGGKFVSEMAWLSDRYVKDYTDEADYKSPDIDIAIDLKTRGMALNVQKYVHSYPHCWRTDKPVIYYPLDSWFVKAKSIKDKLIANNNKINWKPASTGIGRFGQWLENLQDWNLSRSRFWGIPLPIWMSEGKEVKVCINSVEKLILHIEEAISSDLLNEEEKKSNQDFIDRWNTDKGDLHKPYIDYVTLVKDGKVLKREPEVIDVWFDSGSMPYAQLHYPFENQEKFKKSYPADFISEGVDQTRGWFYTLHVISTILFDKPAYKNVISTGLVLDKDGEKMSKSKGNVVDPFKTIDDYGADSTRWYIVSNSAPWDNLKFDLKGIEEVKRKFFGTLYNTYSFFAMYANIDNFQYDKVEAENKLNSRPELDRWIVSKLNSLIKNVENSFENYEPTQACRYIEDFLDNHLSNWYVRLNRRRFWKNEVSEDKKMAYQTLYECLNVVSTLMSPVAPFFSEWLYQNLNNKSESVHLAQWPTIQENKIDAILEKRMQAAQQMSSLILSLRKKENIKVRQPLNTVIVPVLNEETKSLYVSIEDIVKSEVNVKSFEYIDEGSGKITKKAKPNFKVLGAKLGKSMGEVGKKISAFSQDDISRIEKEGFIQVEANNEKFDIKINEIEISTSDMPGYLVASEGGITLALDITLTPELVDEGIAREFVNKVQNIRKESGFEITDRIIIGYQKNETFDKMLTTYKNYIANEVLADDIVPHETINEYNELEINEINLKVKINKQQ